jgi:hydrogenase maturation protease
MMTSKLGPAVVIGVGNVLRGDDGVGVLAVEALRAVAQRDPSVLPEATRIVDGGTLGLELIGEVEGARSLLLVDAVDFGRAPGAVCVLRGEAILSIGEHGSGADGVAELVSVARLLGRLPGHVALVGVQAAAIGQGIGLSEPVAAALPHAVAMACEELRKLDLPVMTAVSRRDGQDHAEGAAA